jgi:hypothetical protein
MAQSLEWGFFEVSSRKSFQGFADMLALFTGRMHRPLNITYIIDDNPAVMLPHAQRERSRSCMTRFRCRES